MKTWSITSIVLFIVLSQASHADRLRVGVSVLPLESVVREIGGADVEVRSLQQEGDSCSVFEPRPSSIAWLSRAAVFFRTGAGYESILMEKIRRQFGDLQIVDLRESIQPILLEGHAHHGHAHHGEHCASCAADGATDPHIWLDPVNVASMGDRIASALARLVPEKAAAFTARAAAFRKRAMERDAYLRELLEPYAGKSFFIYHPALGYFAERYHLEQVAIASSGDAPTARELHAKIRLAREQGIGTVFVQPQESRRQAEVLAEAIGAEIVEINPMATDWDENLARIGEALARSFAE